VLRKLLGSRAFAIMERISRLNQRGKGPVVSREEVSRALGD
jgi:hypothetical protein